MTKTLSLLIIMSLLLTCLPGHLVFGQDKPVNLPVAAGSEPDKPVAKKDQKPAEAAKPRSEKTGPALSPEEENRLAALKDRVEAEAAANFDGDAQAFLADVQLTPVADRDRDRPLVNWEPVDPDKGYLALSFDRVRLQVGDSLTLRLAEGVTLVRAYYQPADLASLQDRLAGAEDPRAGLQALEEIAPAYALDREGLAPIDPADSPTEDQEKFLTLQVTKADLAHFKLLVQVPRPLTGPLVQVSFKETDSGESFTLQAGKAKKSTGVKTGPAAGPEAPGLEETPEGIDPADPEAEDQSKDMDTLTGALGPLYEDGILPDLAPPKLRSSRSHHDHDYYHDDYGSGKTIWVSKKWSDGNQNHQGQSVTVYLYKNYKVKLENSYKKEKTLRNVPYKTLTVSADYRWQASIDDVRSEKEQEDHIKDRKDIFEEDLRRIGESVPRYKKIKEVKDFYYTIAEKPVQGYSSRVSGRGGNFTITNTSNNPNPKPNPEPAPNPDSGYDKGKAIRIQKIWQNDDEESRPESITVKLCKTYTVKLKDSNRKYITLKDVPYQTITLSKAEGWDKTIYEYLEKQQERYIRENPGQFEKDMRLIGEEVPSYKYIDEVKDFSYSIQEEPIKGYTGRVSRYGGKFTITNRATDLKPNPEPGPAPNPNPSDIDTDLRVNKMIDYLGDDGKNSDTDLAGEDAYRQYLEIQGEEAQVDAPGYDFLIAVDTTSSMTADDYSGEQRDVVANRLLNGDDRYSTADGLLTKLLAANPKNKAAVMTFVGQGRDKKHTEGYALDKETGYQLEWTSLGNQSKAPYTSVLYDSGSGTNYCTPLYRAAQIFNEVQNDGNKKVLIFITDGEPNEYVTKYDRDNTVYIPGYKKGGSWEDRRAYTEAAYNYLKSQVNENIDFHAIAIKITEDRRGDLQALANMAGGDVHPADDAAQLEQAFNDIATVYYPNNLYLEDTLSKYVNLNTDRLDFKIKMLKNGRETVIWQGEPRPDDYNEHYNYTPIGYATNGGGNIIDWASYSQNVYGKDRVQVKFKPGYNLGGARFRVSYNIKANQTAKDYLRDNNNQYPDVGDRETDFGKNATSSNKAGFHSNTRAVIRYRQHGQDHTKLFPHPVVQASPSDPEQVPEPGPNPSDLKPEVKVHKQIDFLGDGVQNKDTDIQKGAKQNQLNDLYRLYLDVEGIKAKKNDAVDLLFVIDHSRSMAKKDMTGPNGETWNRSQAVMHLLNDTTLVHNFLGKNENNRVAFVAFDGIKKQKDAYSYQRDVAVIRGWSHHFDGGITLPIPNRGYGSTNYHAGLYKALDMFKGSRNKKVMIFISDGVPTMFIQEDGTPGGGGGPYDVNNVRACRNAVMGYIQNTFYKDHPDILTYAVGVSRDITQPNPKTSASPVILQEMARLSGGDYIGVDTDTNELVNRLSSVIEKAVSGVVIEDELSDYVDMVDRSQRDFKVIKRDRNGREEVLWGDGEPDGCIQNLLYERSKRRVILVFAPDYKLEDGCKYVLSYNIKVNDKVKAYYMEHRAYDAEGDAGTDYGNNATSSKQPGFHSNKAAKVSFNGGEQAYPHPVVQVQDVPGRELPDAGGLGRSRLSLAVGLSVLSLSGLALRRRRSF
ncbi:hypothetical protein ACKQTC_06745 [Peptococcus simiae]|uniref:VWFA domain-containing protein n=1 Tax=Peptococcus simiae TaxID=1643805 RepID=A0ABW9H061_9FIRM